MHLTEIEMKTREEVARFIERQIHWKHRCAREKGLQHHYGLQELRELMDFIYESAPTETECIRKLSVDWDPDA